MNNPAADTTSLFGTGNLISLAPDANRPAIPSGVEQVAASTPSDARAAGTDGGKPNQQSNASGSTKSSGDALEKSKKECNELLAKAIFDAELLAIYVSRNGIDVTPPVLQGIADSRELFHNGKLSGKPEGEFLTHYRELASVAFPVTVASLRDSSVEQEHSLPWWLFFGRKLKFIPANVASYTHWAFAGIALLLLILTQSYYVVGNNLIQLLPEYRLLKGQEQAVLNAVAPKSEAAEQPEMRGEGSFDRLLTADRTMLCKWLAWCPLIDTPVKVSTTSNPAEADTDATVVMSGQVLRVLEWYLLPLLYGWIGAAAYVVRSLAREARDQLYRRENDTAYTLRIFLGALAGLAIGWFLKPEDVSGFKALSPFALAFIAGYSVDLLFTFLDKIVNAFSAPQDVPPAKALQTSARKLPIS
jgi:hypothetical protein